MDPPKLPTAILSRKAAYYRCATRVLVDKVGAIVDNIVDNYPQNIAIPFCRVDFVLGNERQRSI
jgi:hypothetical protein